MRPSGEAFALLHFHDSRRALATPGVLGPALTRDRLVLALYETARNISSAEPQ